MTDIKAYEGLTANQQLNLFRNMYYNDGNTTEKGIIANAINDILHEYNRLRAEIERVNDGCSNCYVVQTKSEKICDLYEQIEYWKRGYNDFQQEIKTVKAEAIKEFAEIVKDKQYNILRAHCNMAVICECDDCIDGLVKERTGEQK